MEVRRFTKFLRGVVKLLNDNNVKIRDIYKLDSLSSLHESKRYIIYEAGDDDIKLMEFNPNVLDDGKILWYDPNNSIKRILNQLATNKCVIEKVDEGVYDIYVKDRLEGLYLRFLLDKEAV